MATTTMDSVQSASTPIFSDVNPDVREERYEQVLNESAIQKSIQTIFGTRKKTRPFRRSFGTILDDLLFDPVDDITAMKIRRELIDAIRIWETRIVMDEAVVIPNYENQEYYVSLTYHIPQLQDKSVTFTFNLAKETRT